MDVIAHSHLSVATVASFPPVASGAWAADLLDHFRDTAPEDGGVPDDGTRYEILDGVLLVSPSPGRGHQRMLVELLKVLDAASPVEFEVYTAPLDWFLDSRTVLQPDISVVHTASWPYQPKVTETPILAVEVASPSTSRQDRTIKFEAYARLGVRQYWIADPGRAGRSPTITVYELAATRYRLAAQASGSEPLTVTEPIAVRVIPDEVAGITR